MEQVANQVIFFLLSAVVVVCSIMAVTSRRILRAATYLLFVLFATAGYYFQLDYHFLGAVQVTIYAGGILVLFVFAILLTSKLGEKSDRISSSNLGACICGYTLLTHDFFPSRFSEAGEIDMKVIGHALMGMDKYQYLLPFEAISVLLLACIIGGIMIARKR